MSGNAFEPGDTVIVTGAAQGLGRAIAGRLAMMGARLALWDIQEDRLDETVALCRQAGADVRAARVDVSAESEVRQEAAAIRSALGRPFALVNNAGIYPRSPVLGMDPQLWQRVFNVNLYGSFLCAQSFAPMMLEAGRGAVVNIASSAALRGTSRGAHYAASKAGLVSFTQSLALELAPKVRVNCILPGLTETAQPLSDMSLEHLQEKGRQTPLGRAGTPEDIAGMVAILLGPDTTYMTGQSIAVNGGAIMLP